MKKQKQGGPIVAIGGGELKNGGTLAIDQEIVRLCGKPRPRALFIPTASNDAPGYCEVFRAIYGERLGCTVDILKLGSPADNRKEIEKKILSADLVYVGGGNTALMMKRWRIAGIDRLLIRAHAKGIVLAGLSAGAICWFTSGLSDSRRFTSRNNTFSFIRVTGLNLVPGMVSPHHIREKKKRDPVLRSVIGRYGGMALAIDDNAAIVVQGEKYRVYTSRSGVSAHVFFRKKGNNEVCVKKIEDEGSLPDLLSAK